ncbi:hypothetical protein GF362_06590 [Candidatus Dojkabacteria bacterium]|nr:hypothetical protein [Candidatus Dojkabacteria bacterium]
MVGISPAETNYIPENENNNNNEKKVDDTVLVNITAEFDDLTIRNVEEEFGKSYEELKGTELDYFGIIVYFYENTIPGKYEINFRSSDKAEIISEAKLRIMEFISHLEGRPLE